MRRNSHQDSGCSIQFAFMGYFCSVNNYKLKMGSKLVLGLMLLKVVLVVALFGMGTKSALMCN